MRVQSLGWEDPLEKGMATHSSNLAWRIPWTEEPGGLQGPWGHQQLDTTERLSKHQAALQRVCVTDILGHQRCSHCSVCV